MSCGNAKRENLYLARHGDWRTKQHDTTKTIPELWQVYKEMVIDFKKNEQLFPAISVDSKDLELVNSVKILGVSISNNLQWNVHATEVIKRANKHFYFLVLLKKKNFYCACLRPVLEYCAVVFHHTLNCFQNTFTPPATSCLQIISSTLK